jgi:hypothetical protein
VVIEANLPPLSHGIKDAVLDLTAKTATAQSTAADTNEALETFASLIPWLSGDVASLH